MLIIVGYAELTQYQICGFYEGGNLYNPHQLPLYHILTTNDFPSSVLRK
uniref:Uncharacterized protein n=1 Tax=Heterorhabditis bacteriophora TaxID=37862 RepID=A0A1I7XCE7_HETBA